MKYIIYFSLEGAYVQFILHFCGWMQSSIAVMKLLQDGNVVDCSHSLSPPENGLIHATGDIVEVTRASGEDEPVVVVCGGEFVQSSSSSNIPNHQCVMLSEKEPSPVMDSIPMYLSSHVSAGGFLNDIRIGASSVIMANGRTLWVTGGHNHQTVIESSEFIQAHDKFTGFTTNGVGPDLPSGPLMHHCLERVASDIAILIGGMPSDSSKLRFMLIFV